MARIRYGLGTPWVIVGKAGVYRVEVVRVRCLQEEPPLVPSILLVTWHKNTDALGLFVGRWERFAGYAQRLGAGVPSSLQVLVVVYR